MRERTLTKTVRILVKETKLKLVRKLRCKGRVRCSIDIAYSWPQFVFYRLLNTSNNKKIVTFIVCKPTFKSQQ